MSIRIECACGKRLVVEDDFPADEGQCPACGGTIAFRPPARHPDLPAPHLPPPTGKPPSRRRTATYTGPAAESGRRGGAWLPMLLTLTAGAPAILALVVVASLKQDNARLTAQVARLQVELTSHTDTNTDAEAGSGPAANPNAAPSDVGAAIARLERRLAALDRRVDERPAGPGSSAPPPALEAALTRVARRASPAVVALVTDRGAGSGVVISEDGYILTNEHVVGGRRVIEVHFPSGARHRARLLATDAISDVALIRVEARGLASLPLGDSEALRVGQVVVALGNPFGLSRDGKPTMTLGIVSALHRIVTPGDGRRRYGDAIQTDAAINPGNSGGALVDLEGRLVGINGAISSRTGTSAGVGFAIPVNFIKKILDRLKAGHSTHPGYLGITTREMTAAEQREHGQTRGAVITSVVRGSPAMRGGLEPGMLITRLEGKPVSSSIELVNRLSYHQAGELLRVGVLGNDGATHDLQVRVGRRDGLRPR